MQECRNQEAVHILGLIQDQSGGVAVDWIAVTAGSLLLGTMVVFAVFNDGVSSLTSSTNDVLGSVQLSAATGHTPNINAAAEQGQTGEGGLDAIAVAGDEPSSREQRRAERRAQRQAERQARRQARREARRAQRQARRATR